MPARHCLRSHKGAVNCVSFHPVFTSIASGSDDCTIKVWDWEFGELEKTVKGHTQAVRDIDYGGPKGGILLASCSSDLTIKLWDPADDYKNIRTLHGHEHIINSVRFIPAGKGNDGSLLVSGSGDHSLKIWNTQTGHCVQTLQGHTDWVRSVCPSSDGHSLLSAGNDHTARLWDVSAPSSDNAMMLVGHGHGINCCAFAPATSYTYLAAIASYTTPPTPDSSAEFAATGSRDKTIRLWNNRGNCLKTLTGHNNWISAIEFHPGGKYLLSVADDKTLRCWDLSQGGLCVAVLEGVHEQFITCLKWAPGISKLPSSIACESASGQVDAHLKATPLKEQTRCIVATGSMDMTLNVFIG